MRDLLGFALHVTYSVVVIPNSPRIFSSHSRGPAVRSPSVARCVRWLLEGVQLERFLLCHPSLLRRRASPCGRRTALAYLLLLQLRRLRVVGRSFAVALARPGDECFQRRIIDDLLCAVLRYAECKYIVWVVGIAFVRAFESIAQVACWRAPSRLLASPSPDAMRCAALLLISRCVASGHR